MTRARKEFRQQLQVQLADLLAVELGAHEKARPPRNVDHGTRQSLVQRHQSVPKAANAGQLAQSLTQSLTENNADILHRVVGIHLQVALGADAQIHHAVARQLVEHVVEKPIPVVQSH